MSHSIGKVGPKSCFHDEQLVFARSAYPAISIRYFFPSSRLLFRSEERITPATIAGFAAKPYNPLTKRDIETTTFPQNVASITTNNMPSKSSKYQCKQSKHMPKRLTSKLQGDNDVWVEAITYYTRTKTSRHYFQSVTTGVLVWDEPPSGASHVILQDEIPQFGPELKKYLVVSPSVRPPRQAKTSWFSALLRK